MSIEEDTINPIINFFHKLLGNNLWIIPVSVGIASWVIYYIYPDKWIVLYIAITCSVIAVLHMCSNLYLWIKNTIKKHKEVAAAKELENYRREQEIAANQRKNLEYASAIWKLVAHIDNDIIKSATKFLSLDVHDRDKHVRFLKIPKESHSPEGKLYACLFNIILKLTFSNGYNSTYRLIREERIKDIMYYYIDSYFLSLLENYKDTGKWEKI